MAVVILHVKDDTKGAVKLAQRLKHQGFDVWCTDDILVGESDVREHDMKISQARFIIVYGTVAAAGTKSIRRKCETIRKNIGAGGVEKLIIAQMNSEADVDSLNPDTKHVYFCQDYETAFDALCHVLGQPPTTLTYATTIQSLRDGNWLRIAAHVGEKFRPNLYVSRDLEQQVRVFTNDPGSLIDSCTELLTNTLKPYIETKETKNLLCKDGYHYKPLTGTERSAIQKALDSCLDKSILYDQKPFEALESVLLPPTYRLIDSELTSFRDYILGSPSTLSLFKLHSMYTQLEGQLIKAKVTNDIFEALKELWTSVTEISLVPYRYDINLIRSANVDDIQCIGCGLIVIAFLESACIHIRIFDSNGQIVVDKPENELMSGDALSKLKNLLSSSEQKILRLTKKDELSFIKNAALIARYTLPSEKECLPTNKPDEWIMIRKLSSSSSSTRESEDFVTVRHRLNMLFRKVRAWSRSRILTFYKIDSKDDDRKTQVQVAPVYVNSILQRCEDLIDAVNKKCLLIVDVAGSGKTNMLSAISINEAFGSPVIVMYAKVFDEGGNIILNALNGVIESDLHPRFGIRNFDDYIANISNDLEREKKNLLVMIDGINEFSNDAALAESIRLSVVKYHKNRVKFVATCRDIYWSFFKDTLHGMSYKTNIGNLRHYNDAEFEIVFSKYLKEFGLTGIKIGQAARDAFRSPILLRFFCEAYGVSGGRQKPDAPARVGTVNLKRLFDDYIRAKLQRLVEIGQTKIRYSGGCREKRTMEASIIRIASRIKQVNRPYLSRDEASATLEEKDIESRASTYSLLLDEDIILEERNGRVFFVYEAFMEYAIAKSMLQNITRENARALLDYMVNETHNFTNMRGVVLMTLIMLSEEQRIDLTLHVLSKGDQWVAVVLQAIEQFPPIRITDKTIKALCKIADCNNSMDRKEALRLLLVRGGDSGRTAILSLIRNGSKRQLNEVIKLLPSFGNAEMLKTLIEHIKLNDDHVELALLAIAPSRRGLAHIKKSLGDPRSNVVAVLLRVLTKVKSGEVNRAIDLASDYQNDPRMIVAETAKYCIKTLKERLESSEIARREAISKSYRLH